MSPHLHLRLLGGFTLEVGGQPAPALPYEKARALVAWLALHPGPQPRDSLADLLWPEAAGEQARTNLRRALFDLRRVWNGLPGLPADWLQADRRQVGLAPDLGWQVDALALEAGPLPPSQAETLAPTERHAEGAAQTDWSAWQDRLALYRGPLLRGLDLPDTPAFDTWLQARRQALQRRHLELARRVAEGLSARGAHDPAADLLRQALQHDPWDEPAQRQLMGLLARRSVAAARAHYEAFRQQLVQALGVQPDAQTQALAAGWGEGQTPPQAAQAGRRRVQVLAASLSPRPEADPETAEAQVRILLAEAAQSLAGGPALVRRADQGELLLYIGHAQSTEQAPRLALTTARQLLARWQDHPQVRAGLGLHAGWTVIDPQDPQPDASGALARPARQLALGAPDGALWLSDDMAELARRLDDATGRPVRLGPGQHAWQPQPVLPHPQAPAHTLDDLPLAGRQTELALLQQAWAQTRAGGFCARWLQAEPGLGKSRLLRALAAPLAANATPADPAPAAVCRWLRCQPEFSHSPFHPVLAWLTEGPLQADGRDAGQRQRLALRHLAPARLDTPAHEATLSRLLGAVLSQNPPLPAERRRQDEALLGALLTHRPAGAPLLLVVEDLHWADASTLDLLARLCEHAPPGLMLAASCRPPGLPAGTALTRALGEPLVLRPLDLAAMRQLAHDLGLDEAAARDVVRRADGVPLFAEELARGWRQGATPAAPAPPGAARDPVPGTLWDLLAERLDALPAPARRLAQAAAVMGRDFDAPLLGHVLDLPPTALRAGLRTLAQAGLLLHEDLEANRFRHALMRDVAYLSLGGAERRALHAQVGRALRGPWAARVAELPELLAHHLTEAGDPQAATWWLAAGRRAVAQCSLSEALHHLQAGDLALAGLDARDPLRRRLEAPLLQVLGQTLQAVQGYGSGAAKTCFRRLRALAQDEAGTAPGTEFSALWGLWLGGRGHDDDTPALQVASLLTQAAARSQDPVETVQAQYALGNNLLFLGRLGEAGPCLQAATERAATLPPARLVARVGEDSGLCAQAMQGWRLALQGQVHQALALSQQNLESAACLGHAPTQGYALTFAAVLHRHLLQPEQTLALCGQVQALADEHGLALWAASAAAVGGWAQVALGDAEGLGPLRAGVAAAQQAMPSVESTFLHFLADALLRLQQWDEALACVDEGLAKGRARHEEYLFAEFLRLRALALVRGQPLATQRQAWTALEQAAHTAQTQGAHWLGLRVALAQAQGWQDQQRPDLATLCLGQALAPVAAPAHLPDMAAAQALLRRLRARRPAARAGTANART
ncbi:AAA family ATPase [Ideonella livida]|uniref:AAA family ATPase n=1 Tax=Ideonella livida TaxID=2707176 RepID=A0A7C9PK82_9BURK|nr:AAA family ATPase [Ideonella livida]NDY94013.1 AAA family ATPase [Ideonella livida]